MEQSKVLAALSALSHESRLELIRLLMDKGDEGLAAGAIGEALGLGASRLSFHLSALEQAGLIRSRRASRNVIYVVDREGIGRTLGFLLADCCKGDAKVMACCREASEQADEDGR